MLQIQKIRTDKDSIIKNILEVRKVDVTDQINQVYNLDLKKRDTQKHLDEMSANMNILSSQIGEQFKKGAIEKANILREKTTVLKENIKKFKQSFEELDQSILELLYQIPNTPNELVPPGKSENDNEIIFSSSIDSLKNDSLLPHWELCQKYDLIDFELFDRIAILSAAITIDMVLKESK